MISSTLTIPTPANFSFWRTVYSHGWCALPPFVIDKENRVLRRSIELPSGRNVQTVVGASNSHLRVKIESQRLLSPRERSHIRSRLRECFRLDEDYSEFFSEARRFPQYRWIPRMRAGRLLRAPTVFEDVVKMICTTNCSWALTESMVGNLTAMLGEPLEGGGRSFPTPEAIASTTESFLRKKIRTGYRSPFLLELARKVSDGTLNLEAWRSSTLPTGELFEQILSVKGVGVYAAGNIMKLVGRYDYLGLDSWVRKKFSELHKNGRTVSDRTIEKHYQPLGKWKGLFFWLEMTRDWYEEKFPF